MMVTIAIELLRPRPVNLLLDPETDLCNLAHGLPDLCTPRALPSSVMPNAFSNRASSSFQMTNQARAFTIFAPTISLER